MSERLCSLIRDIPDFPKKGIVFKDITPLLKDQKALAQVVEDIIRHFSTSKIDCVVGIESRGFIFGALIAYRMGLPFVPVRKKGKLPYKKLTQSYQLEYGVDHIEMHQDAISPGQNVLIIDDLLATGGTALATCKLVEALGGKVAGCAFVVELAFLKGRQKLMPYPILSLVTYDS
jgi:adenine phosphoribosyltransferase